MEAKIKSRSAMVGVLGVGYVGLPLALTFEEAGIPVIGFDVDPGKPAALERGESYIRHLGGSRRLPGAARAGDRGPHSTVSMDNGRVCDVSAEGGEL